MAKWSQACGPFCGRLPLSLGPRQRPLKSGSKNARVKRLKCFFEAWDAFWSDSSVPQGSHESGKIAGCPCHTRSVLQPTFQRAFTYRVFSASSVAPRLAFTEAPPVSQLPQHRLRLREGACVGRGPEPPPFHLRGAVKSGLVGCLCRWHARS